MRWAGGEPGRAETWCAGKHAAILPPPQQRRAACRARSSTPPQQRRAACKGAHHRREVEVWGEGHGLLRKPVLFLPLLLPLRLRVAAKLALQQGDVETSEARRVSRGRRAVAGERPRMRGR